MCGIFGAINCPLDESMLDLIRHRGPDDGDLRSYTVGEHRIDLGHRRLAILDLSPAGRQPMETPEGVHSLIYNGEVYNHLDLRHMFALDGEVFKGSSDTETILYALARSGISAVECFNGIFAFAFLDQEKFKLYLVRDPFGVKPLYYRVEGNSVVFCSELRPILKRIPDEPDFVKMALALKLRYTPSPYTLFRNTHRLRPGHVLEIDLSSSDLRFQEFSYINLLANEQKVSMEDAVQRYGELFERAVERQLMADVEVGVLLSGGMDSALVAAHAKKYVTYPIKAFTVGFTGNHEVDELEDAAMTARMLGLTHYPIRIGYEDFLGAMEKCIEVVEEPLATTSIIPMYYLAQEVSRHVKVVLSGQGADEPLGGYGRYRGQLIADWIPRWLASSVCAITNGIEIRSERIQRGLRAASEDDELARFLAIYSVFEDSEIEELLGTKDVLAQECLIYWYRKLGCERRKKSVERMMSMDLRMNLADDLLLYTDKITMNFSLECRVPILDLDVVRFVESLPHHYRVSWLNGKIIHTLFAFNALPAQIVRRKKRGFASPTNTWFRDGDRLREILLDKSSRFASFFNLSIVERIIRQHENGINREKQIFMLLGFHYWLSHFA